MARNGASLSGRGQGSKQWVSNVKNDFQAAYLRCGEMKNATIRALRMPEMTWQTPVNSGHRNRIASAELDGAGAMRCEFRFRERAVSEQRGKNLSRSLPAASGCKASLYAH